MRSVLRRSVLDTRTGDLESNKRAQPLATLIEDGVRLVDHGLAFRINKPDDGVLASPLNRGHVVEIDVDTDLCGAGKGPCADRP